MAKTITINDKLAAGAQAIRKAEADALGDKPFTDKELKPTRDAKDVFEDRVTVLEGHIGLKLDPQTTPAEHMQILDAVVLMGDHFQFMIGDVVNDGEWRFGEKKYRDALNRTGRARRTLQEWARTSLVIPHSKRVMGLSFSHHAAVARLGNGSPKIDEVLGKISKNKDEIEVRDVRAIVQKVAPPKPAKPRKATGGKRGRRAAKPEVEVYKPTEEEEAKMDNFLDALEEAENAGRAVRSVLLKIDNKRKNEFTKALEWLCSFRVDIQKSTGYTG